MYVHICRVLNLDLHDLTKDLCLIKTGQKTSNGNRVPTKRNIIKLNASERIFVW